MALGGLAFVFGIAVPFLAKTLLYMSLPFLIYFKHVSGYLALLPGVINISSLPLEFSIGYYALLL